MHKPHHGAVICNLVLQTIITVAGLFLDASYLWSCARQISIHIHVHTQNRLQKIILLLQHQKFNKNDLNIVRDFFYHF